jgi:hypothetical protein
MKTNLQNDYYYYFHHFVHRKIINFCVALVDIETEVERNLAVQCIAHINVLGDILYYHALHNIRTCPSIFYYDGYHMLLKIIKNTLLKRNNFEVKKRGIKY